MGRVSTTLLIATTALLFVQIAWGYASIRKTSWTYRSSLSGGSISLQCSTGTITSVPESYISFHRAEREDMKGVAEMLSAAFDKKPNAIIRWYSIWNYEEQLKERLVRLVEMGKNHSMVVAGIDLQDGTGTKYMGGFIELGLLPLPDDKIPTPLYAEFDDILEGSGLRQVPTIGNLVVDAKFRRRGVARAMLKEAVRTAESWEYPVITCAVDPNNPAAIGLYEGEGFHHVYTAKTAVQINVLQTMRDLSLYAKRLD